MQYELVYNNLTYPLPKYTAAVSKEMLWIRNANTNQCMSLCEKQ